MSVASLVDGAIDVLERRLEATGAIIAPDVAFGAFAAEVRRAVAIERAAPPNTCPLVGAPGLVPTERHPDTEELVDAYLDSFEDLLWFRSDLVPSDFVSRSCAGELVGPAGTYRADGIRTGFFQITPDADYPPHRHDAEENYVLLAGSATVEIDDETVRARPGDVVHVPSGRSHSIRTAGEGALILYTWFGDVSYDSYVVDPIG